MIHQADNLRSFQSSVLRCYRDRRYQCKPNRFPVCYECDIKLLLNKNLQSGIPSSNHQTNILNIFLKHYLELQQSLKKLEIKEEREKRKLILGDVKHEC
jgi:hypothetical protein